MEEGKRDDRGYSGEVDFRDRGPGGPEEGEQSLPLGIGTALIQRSGPCGPQQATGAAKEGQAHASGFSVASERVL